jgi:ERCC4-type nuclease
MIIPAANGFQLPALRSLGDLAGVEPVIVIDSREQQPLVFTRLPSRTATLKTADYSLDGCVHTVAIERKSSTDELITCFTTERERFEAELLRMMAYPFRRLAIIGDQNDIESHRYRSRAAPRSVLHTLSAFEVRYQLPICFFPNDEAMAKQVESWIFWIARDVVRDANNLLRASRFRDENGK